MESKRGTHVATVLENSRLCDQHYMLRLGLEQLPPCRPGQFVQLQCRPMTEQVSAHAVDWAEGKWPHLEQPELAGKEPLLRRPLSIACRSNLSAHGNLTAELDLIYRAVGSGTTWLSHLEVAAKVSVLGPLGNGFVIDPNKPKAVLIGGGVGIPPMLYLAEALQAAGKETIAFCGARTAEMLPLCPQREKVSPLGRPELCVEEFSRRGAKTVIATDDGSLGVAGNVSSAFETWLNLHLPSEDELVVYSCGPEAMMQAAAIICLSRGYRCQVAMERHMACGMGTCQSCIVKIRDKSESGWSFKLCCTDGPVFEAEKILW